MAMSCPARPVQVQLGIAPANGAIGEQHPGAGKVGPGPAVQTARLENMVAATGTGSGPAGSGRPVPVECKFGLFDRI